MWLPYSSHSPWTEKFAANMVRKAIQGRAKPTQNTYQDAKMVEHVCGNRVVADLKLELGVLEKNVKVLWFELETQGHSPFKNQAYPARLSPKKIITYAIFLTDPVQVV
jgi:hypothetical protein